MDTLERLHGVSYKLVSALLSPEQAARELDAIAREFAVAEADKPRTVPLYVRFARTLEAMENCRKRGNAEWLDKWTEDLGKLCREYMPSGSGFDAGTTLDDASKPDVLRFSADFHHMDEYGGYDGWTEHTVTVRPSLAHGIVLRVSGRDRNGIKDYIADTFRETLTQEVPEYG